MGKEIERIKAIPILEVAAKLGIEIKRNKAVCFRGHDSKTPSLGFNVKENYWHCFGCGIGGNTLDLVRLYLDLTFSETMLWFKDTERIQHRPKALREDATNRHRTNIPDPEIFEWLINTSGLSKEGLTYLNNRGFKLETIQHFTIKAIKSPRQKFADAVDVWGVDKLLKCGLAKRTVSGEYGFVWWDHIILFPFYDEKNRVVNIQGRQLGDKLPKYINLQGIKTTIYNLKVINDLKPDDYLYICEGIPDVLTAHQHNWAAVGIIGAHGFKTEWAKLLMKYRIRVIPDNDSAGELFSSKIKTAFNHIGKSVQIKKIPKGKDLTDFCYDN